MRFLLVVLAAACATPAAAQTITYPVSIPFECVPLAEREHRPTIIESRTQALLAEARLRSMPRRDPLVRQCREAIDKLKARMKEPRP